MTNSQCMIRFIGLYVALTAGITFIGCGKTLRVDYGKSRGSAGDQSINGFGVLRRAYARTGWSTRDINRLNDRLATTTAIVWTPTERDTLYDESTEWFDQWLSEKTRTLVYIVPDQGCQARYYGVARQAAPKDQKLEYRRQLARIETEQMLVRLSTEPIPNNGWFSIERAPADTILGGIRTSESLSEWTLPRTIEPSGRSSDVVAVEYKIVPVPAAIAPSPTSQPSPPNTQHSRNPWSWQVYGSSKVKLAHQSLLRADYGSPIITRITAEEWGESKLIVVGNGSLLCNFSLTTPQGQAVATQLIAETGDSSGLVGFLTTDSAGANVSEVDPEINAMTGMELFTVWPLSLIVLHLAVTGFIACMILLPIFGRPRQGKTVSNSDFADHLDAVAVLMSRSGGEEYARRRVSEYMRRIRGETTGQWVQPFAEPPSAPATLLLSSNIATPPTKAAP